MRCEQNARVRDRPSRCVCASAKKPARVPFKCESAHPRNMVGAAASKMFLGVKRFGVAMGSRTVGVAFPGLLLAQPQTKDASFAPSIYVDLKSGHPSPYFCWRVELLYAPLHPISALHRTSLRSL